MIKDIVVATITMNAGTGIPGSTLRWALINQFNKFKKVVVVDGDLTEEAKEYYKQFSNVEVVDSPWNDSYVKQYRTWLERIEEGQWAVYYDDDEFSGAALMNFLETNDWKKDPNYLYYIPCVLHLTEDGKKYYAAENPPTKEFKGQWTKSIIIKKHKSLTHNFQGSHVIMYHSDFEINQKKKYLPLDYIHAKTLESFVWNDSLQALLLPEAQHYTPANANKFRMFASCYKTTKEFKESIKKGTWPPTLKKFAWEHRHEYGNPISRLAWVYYILEGHPMPHDDIFMTWQNVKKYVLSPTCMEVYNKNKETQLFLEINGN